jgi:hypothetical protein
MLETHFSGKVVVLIGKKSGLKLATPSYADRLFWV